MKLFIHGQTPRLQYYVSEIISVAPVITLQIIIEITNITLTSTYWIVLNGHPVRDRVREHLEFFRVSTF